MNYKVEIQKINKILAADYDHEIPDKIRSHKFHRAFTNLMQRLFPDYQIIPSNVYCKASGFIITHDQKCVYYSTNDYRYKSWNQGILYRKAKDKHDFTGGNNHFANLDYLKDCIEDLIK